MSQKGKEREKAIKLRRKGLSYREILKEVPVAKSTLSLWLRDVGLSKKQKQRLTEKKLQAALRGSQVRRRQRVEKTEKIIKEASNQVGEISKRDLWLMGTMLYWAEGAKEKSWSAGTDVKFSNSDPLMIGLFIKWLKEVCEIRGEEIRLDIYIHENSINRIPEVKKYWSNELKLPLESLQSVYFKKHKLSTKKTKRRNAGKDYYGLILVRVKASTDLNRKITGWINGICRELLKI